LKPLAENLGKLETNTKLMEEKRDKAYGSLETHLQKLITSTESLQKSSSSLATALRGSSQARGRWGEIALKNVAELAGMTEHCDFELQAVAEGLRPDMVVRLPAGREIVIDAKVPLSAYLDALAAASDEERAAGMARHAQQVRQHMSALASRAYWDEFAKAADLVVMFIPGEAFVSAAAQADATLIEDGLARKVVVATPTTLIALLRSVAYGWRQEQVADNAARISELGRQLYDRLRALTGHVAEVGASLGRATAAYNRAVGSMEARVLPAARRFRDLGAAAGEELPLLEAVTEHPRGAAPEPPALARREEA